MKDYLPTTDEGLLAWSQNFTACLKEYGAALELNKKSINEFEALTLKFEAALKRSKSLQHRNKDGVGKNTTADALRKMARMIVRRDLYYNPRMTLELRILMRLNVKAPPRKRERPKSKPRLVLEIAKGRITAKYYDETSGRRAKPDGIHFIEYVWELVDTPPESADKLAHHVRQTSGPLELVFAECDRGKPCCIAARWENDQGDTGAWSDIEKIFVP